MDVYMTRRHKLAEYLKSQNIAMAMFEDTEGRRDTSIRYYTGQPSDALLFISASGDSILVPWDINMADLLAHIETKIAYSEFGRSALDALANAVEKLSIPKGSVIDMPPVTPYPRYADYVEKVPDYDLRCQVENSAASETEKMRAVKDADEIKLYHEVSAITNRAMDEIEKAVRDGKFKTETDIALFIERFLRENKCENVGFETLAAGPSRSFGIHCFPYYTAADFGTDGMSILDFGLSYKGYTSDVTMTFVRGKLSDKQHKMIELVKKAHDWAIAECKPGAKAVEIAKGVDQIFSEAGMAMPHGLGHGVGLQAHEAPNLNSRETNKWVLETGHIVTIEPGLYDPELGGVRWEDDILITETGHEVLTKSRIVEL